MKYLYLCVSGTRLVATVFRLSVACWWNTFTETSSTLWVSPLTTSANSWTVFTTTALPPRTKKVCLSAWAKTAVTFPQYPLSPHLTCRPSLATVPPLQPNTTSPPAPDQTARLPVKHTIPRTARQPVLLIRLAFFSPC